MSQALDLLNNLSPDEMSRLAGANPNEARIVIGEDRTIYIPPELRRIAVQFDHNIETVTFECPRYWDGHDMSEMAVCINYMRQDGYTDSYSAVVTSVTEDDKMLFDWTISGNVTEVSGKLSFLVCIEKTNVETGELLHHWSSELSQDMYVSGGMKCKAAPITRDPDLVSQILQRLTNVEQQSTKQALVVEVDEEGNPTHSSEEIYTNAQSGGDTVLRYQGYTYALSQSAEHSAFFVGIDDEKNLSQYEISNSSFIEYDDFPLSSANTNPWYVIWDGSSSIGRTGLPDAILQHVRNGGMAQVWRGSVGDVNQFYSLAYACRDYAIFVYTSDELYIDSVCIYADGSVSTLGRQLVSPSDLEAVDISTQQTWSETKKATARTNIDAASASEVSVVSAKVTSALNTANTAKTTAEAAQLEALQAKNAVSDLGPRVANLEDGVGVAVETAEAASQKADEAMSAVGDIVESLPPDAAEAYGNDFALVVKDGKWVISEAPMCTKADLYGFRSRMDYFDSRLTELETAVGDIDTALDRIIAIQESLIGGDAE